MSTILCSCDGVSFDNRSEQQTKLRRRFIGEKGLLQAATCETGSIAERETGPIRGENSICVRTLVLLPMERNRDSTTGCPEARKPLPLFEMHFWKFEHHSHWQPVRIYMLEGK
jgi:hypothetical protein